MPAIGLFGAEINAAQRLTQRGDYRGERSLARVVGSRQAFLIRVWPHAR